MSKKKLSSLSFTEGYRSGIRISASASNLQSCTSPVSNLLDSPGLFVKSSSGGLRNLFRFKKANSRVLHKRNTLGSVCDVKAYNYYKVSSGCSCDDVLINSIRADRFVSNGNKNSKRSQSIKLFKSNSLRLLHSISSCDDRSLKRLKSLLKYRYKSRTDKMVEGRKAQIIMPWGDVSLEVLIETKSLACDLLETVASKCKLREKPYFGLAYKDETTNHFNWLQPDKRVLDYDLPRINGFFILHFAVRFYVDTYARLQSTTAIELLYLQAKELVFKSELECSEEEVFKLAALVLQEACGDYRDDESTRKLISKYPLLPSFILQKHPSIKFCENRILFYYKTLVLNSRGLVIVGFLSIVESLPAYGSHYYYVKDKDGLPWWLGINGKGISVFDSNDRTRPRKCFEWGNIENIFYRDKKFCLEVHNSRRVLNKLEGPNIYEDAIRNHYSGSDDLSQGISDTNTQMSISKRVCGPSTVEVHYWFCPSSQLTESVWSMAVNQHKFSVEMLLRKSEELRSNEEIIGQLNSSPPLFSDQGWRDSSHPGNDVLVETKKILASSGNDSEVLEKARMQLQILREKKQGLAHKLEDKLKELKKICLDEADLTGELPKEYPCEEGETVPRIKKRIGTSYSFCPDIINTSMASGGLSQQMLEYEIQDKITKAALVLTQEQSISKNIKKSRIETYHKEWKKLKAMEVKLKQMTRGKKGRDEAKRKLRSMAEPSKLHSLAMAEPHSRRSLEALPSISHSSNHSQLHSADLTQTFPNSKVVEPRLEYVQSSRQHPTSLNLSDPYALNSNKNYKSAPSSPTLTKHADIHPRVQQCNSSNLNLKRGFGHPLDVQKKDRCSRQTSEIRYVRDPVNQHNMLSSSSSYPSQRRFYSNEPSHMKQVTQTHSFNRIRNEIVGRSSSSSSAQNSIQHLYSHFGPNNSCTSYVIPLSADPRITSRNLAAGYGLLNCEFLKEEYQKLCSYEPSSHSYFSGVPGRYYSQELPSRSNDTIIDRNFSQIHLSDDLCRYKSGSSSTLSSSSGGASGSASSCNQLFSRSSAYPPASQIVSMHHASAEFGTSSDSSMSMSSSNTYESHQPDNSYCHPSYHQHARWDSNELQMSRRSLDHGDDRPQKAPHSRDSGYDASSQGVRSSTPPFLSSIFNHQQSSLMNSCSPQNKPFHKQETCKPFEMSDCYKYSEARRNVMHHNQLQHFQQRLQGRHNPLVSGSFSSTSTGSHSSLSSASSVSFTGNPPHSADVLHYSANVYPKVCIRGNRNDDTLTRSNVDDYYSGSTDGQSSSRTSNILSNSLSRSRRPILCGSDIPLELSDAPCSNDDTQQIPETDRSLSNTREVSFTSFHLESKVSQEFEAEMLEWYEMNGISPQPDDQYTLV